MKPSTILTAIALSLSAPLAAMADTPRAEGDTVKVINDPGTVTITRSAGVTTVTVAPTGIRPAYTYETTAGQPAPSDSAIAIADAGDDWEDSLPFIKDMRRRRVWEFSGGDMVYGGIVWPDGTGAKTSWELAVGRLLQMRFSPWRNGPSFILGAGIGYRKISVGHGYILDKINGAVLTLPVAEGVDKYSSSLSEINFHIPFSISQPLTRNNALCFTAGVDLVFNTYTEGSSTYFIDNSRFSEKYKGLDQRIFRPEIWGEITCYGVGLYLRYCPVSMFTAAKGPEFKTISAGLVINFNITD